MSLHLTHRLRTLRKRLRVLFLAAGGLRLLCEFLLFLIGAYLLDRWLLVPAMARRVLLVLTAVFFLERFRGLVLYPLRRRIRVEDMARAVERRHRELEGTLVSAVELARTVDHPSPDTSPELLRQWLAQIDQGLAGLRFEHVLQWGSLRRLAGVALVLLLVTGGFAILEPTDTGVFLQRLTGSSAAWPRRTHLSMDVVAESLHYRVERDGDGLLRRVIMARGASLPMEVQVRGDVPDEVFLVIEEVDRSGRREEVRMQQQDEDEGTFHYRFRNVLRSLEVRSRGGDDPGRDQLVEVEVSPPPAVQRLMATITPPAFTGQPAIREERQEFRVPVGTRLDLEVETVGDVVEGSLTFGNDPSTARPLEADPEDGTRWRHSFTVTETGTFNLHLKSRNGFQNLVPLDYMVQALADHAPTLEVVAPSVSQLEVTDRAVVPYLLRAGDDHGLTEVVLSLSRFGREEGLDQRLWIYGDAPVEAGALIPVSHVLDLRELRLARPEGEDQVLRDGDSLLYVLRARDNHQDAAGVDAPNEFALAPRTIDVVRESEKMRKLADRQLRLKQAVQSLKKAQEDRRDAVAAVLAAADSELQAEGRRELTGLEVDQARSATRARQATRDLSGIVDEYLLNRLDESATAERALLFRLGQLEAALGDRRFDAAPLWELVGAHERGDFGELDVSGNLLRMLGLALQASEDHSQAALDALRQARLEADGGGIRGQLETAQVEQEAVIRIYEELLGQMEEWEDFQEILELWRSLVDDQGDIIRRYRNEREDGSPEPSRDG